MHVTRKVALVLLVEGPGHIRNVHLNSESCQKDIKKSMNIVTLQVLPNTEYFIPGNKKMSFSPEFFFPLF